MLIESAKVMAKGQITIPKEIRDKLGVETGDRLIIIWENNQARIMNASVYAMHVLQQEMQGEAEKQDIKEEDIDSLVNDLRKENEDF